MKHNCDNCGTTCFAVKDNTPCLQWTPKEPEPAEPDERWSIVWPGGGIEVVKSSLQPKQPEPVVKENFTAVEPKAEPGLIGCKIIGGKGNELWIVDMPWGNSIALYKAVGRKDFDHIELKSGATVTTLSAFAENDPPVRAYFRKV